MLSGVNAKCRMCNGDCRQWAQLVIVFCPHFNGLRRDKVVMSATSPLGASDKKGPEREDISTGG